MTHPFLVRLSHLPSHCSYAVIRIIVCFSVRLSFRSFQLFFFLSNPSIFSNFAIAYLNMSNSFQALSVDEDINDNNIIDAVSVSTAAQQQQQQLCAVYMEVLIDRYQLQIVDPCPVCSIVVGRHSHNQIPISASTSAAVGLNSEYNNKTYSKTTAASAYSKLASALPKWNKNSVCSTFLESITLLLPTSGIIENDWPNILLYVMNNDVISARWITDNIITAKLSWKEACAIFTTHFQTSDYSITLEKEFYACKQQKHETVQSYADRLTSITTQLGYKDDNVLVVRHFLNFLNGYMLRDYHRTMAILQIHKPDYSLTSLSQAIEFCIKLDVANNTASIHTGGVGYTGSTAANGNNSNEKSLKSFSHNNAGSHGQNSEKKKSGNKTCTIHGQGNHSSAECYKLKFNKQQQSGTMNNNKAQQEAKPDKKHVQCHACKEMGHYANDPKCPQYASRRVNINNASSSASTSSSSTSASSNNASNFVRRSDRESHPPERYNPSSRALTVDEKSSKQSSDAASTTVTSAALTTVAIRNLDRTIPSSIMTSTRSRLIFCCMNRTFDVLIDTGSEISIIDSETAKELDLTIVPSIHGKIKLAEFGSSVNRLGQVHPLSITAILHAPSVAIEQPPISFQHRFDVLPLDRERYQFIVGEDLLSVVFPNGISPSFYSSASQSQLAPSLVNVSAVGIVSNDSTDQIRDQLNPRSKISESEGYGFVPTHEIPDHCMLNTDEQLKVEYHHRRQLIMNDPLIQEAITVNSQITGFCTLPESVIRLDVDPALENTLYRKPYPLPHSRLSAIRDKINQWLATGRIKRAPPGLPYNCPLTVADKKDSFGVITGIRVCLDTRALNRALLPSDRFPLPKIDDILRSFSGRSIYGEFDLEEAYLQYRLHESSQKYTAFTFEGIQYVFVGCPFGLKPLPSHFQRTMATIFYDLNFINIYLDNIPFASNNWDEHKEQALLIIDRCNQVNLRIKPSSINLGQSEMRCLGFVLSQRGISISSSKIDKVQGWNELMIKTGQQMQSFLGLVSYLRGHIRHFAQITGRLYAVSNQPVIEWTAALRADFAVLKQAISTAPTLKQADFSKSFCIATDASNNGIGGVLYQPDDKYGDITADNIVCICSRKLQASELNYPAYKKELVGIVYCLLQFHTWIYGRTDLTLFTDHKPLTYLLDQEKASTTLQQWLDVVLRYDFDIYYRPGELNVLPDALSRLYEKSR